MSEIPQTPYAQLQISPTDAASSILYAATAPPHGPQPTSMTSQQQHAPAAPPRFPSPSEQPSPPHYPISPRAVAAQLATMEPYNPPRTISQPDPVPISESDNTDIAALRSALMILQMQRETARRDIHGLQRLHDEAVHDPEAYVKDLVGRMRQQGERVNASGVESEKENLLAPTLRYVVQGLGEDAQLLKQEKQKDGKKVERIKKAAEIEDSLAMSEDEDTEVNQSKFEVPPKAQNIYRMPPINWAKYQVAGPSLDKLHEEQRSRPISGYPVAADGRADPYMMAGPYLPVVDAARFGSSSEHPMQTRRGTKKD